MAGTVVSDMSPRRALVVHRAKRLLCLAAEFRASGLALCGSVARQQDNEGSDIDLYVGAFELDDEGGPRDKLRATEFVSRIRATLAPYKVDVIPLPGWLLGPEHEASMRRDAVPLEQLAEEDRGEAER